MSAESSNVEKDLFKGEEHVQRYLECRPDYSEDLWRTILDYQAAGEAGRSERRLAVDVGCGSGQSTFPLVAHFEKVIGVDISEGMIKLGQKEAVDRGCSNVTFKLGQAENLDFLTDGSTDLVTCGTAFHWMDVEQLYVEAKRVLKPGGVIAIFTYGTKMMSLDNDDADQALKEIDQKIDSYRYTGNAMIASGFKIINLPFQDVKKVEDLTMRREWSASQLIGYLWTIAAWQKLYNQDQQLCQSILNDFQKKLISIYGPFSADCSQDPTVKVSWPLTLLLGRK